VASEAEKSFVYAFVRRDLSHPQQVVQACHACIEVARSLLPPFDEHPHLVLLGAPSERSLWAILQRLKALGIACKHFCDSDVGNQLTAIATAPVRGGQRRFFRRYQCLKGEESKV
jgi:hypothetical protein